MTEPNERDREMAAAYHPVTCAADLAEFFAAAREEGRREELEWCAHQFEVASKDAEIRARIHSNPRDKEKWNITADNFATAAVIIRIRASARHELHESQQKESEP
jgi:hypothetical protein